jgi:sensor c-di-GMP phosphodiesterase-like protein
MISHDVPKAQRVVTRRRPWALIAAALLLAVLSTILWAKWRDSRTHAEQLQVELRQVYAEAESLRTIATRAQQRVTQLEGEVRALKAAASAPAATAPTDNKPSIPANPKTTR